MFNQKKIAIVSGLFLIILVIILVGLNKESDPTKKAEKDLQKLLSQVGSLMVLPEEIPAVADVVEPEKLKDQPFFKNAKVGDKVLLYPSIGKAILYSPSLNKIIEVAPLNISQNNQILDNQKDNIKNEIKEEVR